MAFYPPSWVPNLPGTVSAPPPQAVLTGVEIPDSISVADFINTEKAGRRAFDKSKRPYTCGVTGASWTAEDVARRVDFLARGLAKNVGFDPNDGTAWDRVVAIYALNTVTPPQFQKVRSSNDSCRLTTSPLHTPSTV
jgi:hypothetical protein